MNKILYVIGSLDVGGAEMHLFQLLPKLKQKNWDVEVFCLGRPGALAQELQKMGIRVSSPLFKHKQGASYIYRLFRMSYSFGSLLVFLSYRRFKVVHFFLPTAYLIGGICSILTFKKFKVMSRRSLNGYQAKYPVLSKIEKKLHRHMNAILGNSRAVISQLEEEGVPDSKLRLIYNGVNFSRFSDIEDRQSVRNKLEIPDSALVFAIVANLIPYKGHRVLLEAFSRIASRLPTPWYLLVIGRDDGIGSELKKYAAECDIADSVKWLGARSDVPALLKSSDIGILSSLEEGFSNAVIECMAAGLPMVVTNVGGNGEAVLDGVSGIVVPPNDPSKMADALLYLASNGSLRKQFALASSQRAHSEFSLEACVDHYDSFYKELVLAK
ncbi:glycosyltransferase [Legionella sp. PATHC035]|uniref:glycosyltransferase n=1 Tax=Legionella sp. PATHC035 TaxID=2992040 RepID=UPI002243F3B3|nr:glycosyltransferase [Legionella sp. PATHC035]MCW8409257.1 glycosyltransferase [Legionella sp. PATHC035]